MTSDAGTGPGFKPSADDGDVLALVGQLHELAVPIERRARQFAADTTDGRTPELRSAGVKALEDDALFLHSLAESLEAIAYAATIEATGAEIVRTIAGMVRYR